MAHLIPALSRRPWLNSDASRWLQFALTTPVVWWAGWPFFRRGARSLLTRHLNMFTLIAVGVGAAFIFSALAMLTPDLFPSTMRHEGKVAIYFGQPASSWFWSSSVKWSSSVPGAAQAVPSRRC